MLLLAALSARNYFEFLPLDQLHLDFLLLFVLIGQTFSFLSEFLCITCYSAIEHRSLRSRVAGVRR